MYKFYIQNIHRKIHSLLLSSILLWWVGHKVQNDELIVPTISTDGWNIRFRMIKLEPRTRTKPQKPYRKTFLPKQSFFLTTPRDQSGKFRISVTAFHFFMFMSLLPASESVYSVHACYPQRPGKGTGSPGTTVSFSWEPPCGSLEEQQMILITEPLL